MADDEDRYWTGGYRGFYRASGHLDHMASSGISGVSTPGGPIFGRPEGDADPAEDGHVAHVEQVVEPERFVFRPKKPMPHQEG